MIIPVGERTKTIEYGAPYVASTFNLQQGCWVARSGPIEGLEINVLGPNITIQPGKILINGIIVELTVPQTLPLPAFADPYILYAYTADEVGSSNVTLDFTDAAGMNPAYVPLVVKEDNGWHQLPYISPEATVANLHGGIRHRVTQTTAGGETSIPFGWPYGIYNHFTDGLLVFKGGKILVEGTDWNRDGQRGIGLTAPAALGEIYHVLMSDDIEFVEVQNVTNVQALITLTKGPYQPGADHLMVFSANGKKILTDDYVETSGTEITLNSSPSVATDFTMVKFKHCYHRDIITLGAGVTLQPLNYVYDPSRVEIMTFFYNNSATETLLLNQSSNRDYVETNGNEITLAPGELYETSQVTDKLEVYRMRSSVPKGIGWFMAEQDGIPPGGGTAGTFNEVLDEGILVGGGPHTKIDFTGAGVTATDQGSGIVEVNVPTPVFTPTTMKDSVHTASLTGPEVFSLAGAGGFAANDEVIAFRNGKFVAQAQWVASNPGADTITLTVANTDEVVFIIVN